MTKIAGIMLLLIGVAGLALAAQGVSTVPEIDAASGVAAFALLSGALLVIRGRRKK